MKYCKLILSVLVVFLAGCNVKVIVTGEGVVTANGVETCDSGQACFSVPRGDTVSLEAIPEDGHAFAGWGGACAEAVGSVCTLSVLGDVQVQASFLAPGQMPVRPLMQPMSEYFFTAPWPNDAYSRRSDGSISTENFPFPQKTRIRNQLQKLASNTYGFSTNGGAIFQLDGYLLDKEPFDSKKENPHAFFVNVDTTSPFYGEVVPSVTTDYSPPDSESDDLALTRLVMVAPLPGHRLRPSTVYSAVILERFVSSDPLLPSRLMEKLDGDYHKSLGFSEPIFEALKQQKTLLIETMSIYGISGVGDIVAFTQYTTQDPKIKDHAIGKTMQDLTDEDYLESVKRVEVVNECYCDSIECDPMQMVVDVEFPNYMTGTGMHVFGGGQIEIDTSGRAVVQGSSPVSLLVSVPCDTRPKGGFPVIAYAAPTGYSWDLDKSFSRGAIHLQLNSPEESERESGSTTKLFDFIGLFIDDEKTIGLVADTLVDFNFLNLEAAINQHVQYGADLHYTLGVGKRLTSILTAGGVDPYEIKRFYYDDNTPTAISGSSLGGIATVHALAQGVDVDTVVVKIAPRPSYLHVASILKYVSAIVPGLDDILLDFTGVDSAEPAQPIMQLVQSVLEPMDTVNYADELVGKNVFWLLAPRYDVVHGGDSGQSMGIALQKEIGAIGVADKDDAYFTEKISILLQNEPVDIESTFTDVDNKGIRMVGLSDGRSRYLQPEYLLFHCFPWVLQNESPFSISPYVVKNSYATNCRHSGL